MKKPIFYITLATVAVLCEAYQPRVVSSNPQPEYGVLDDDILANNELVVSFVVFRHGDRTPDQEELNYYPAGKIDDKHFYPYGKKALTLKGKQRGYRLGEFLRRRYNDSLDQLYLPHEISVRTTDYARTKMTALTALAALYPPTPAQQWNPDINWQPIPYDTLPSNEDDLLYFNNCERHMKIRNTIYELPEIQNAINSQASFYQILSQNAGRDIKLPDHVFQLDNLFQAMDNVGLDIPEWAQNVMPLIKNATKLEYFCLYNNQELIQLAGGVLLGDILNKAKATVASSSGKPKLHLYSGHEINVAAALAALNVFTPHQPKYGSAVLLELRKNIHTGKLAWLVVYAAETGGPGEILPLPDCGGEPLCDFDKLLTITQDIVLSREEYLSKCNTPLT